MARTSFLFRADPAVMEALKRWADDELRSVNGQLEFIVRQALKQSGRLNKPEPDSD
ncbi:MAG: Arc family DNA-binding protein [Pseudomonadota bacterium]